MSFPFEGETHVVSDGGAASSAAGQIADPAVAASSGADLQRARDYGWNERTNLDYDKLQQIGDSNEWLGAAQVYEWKDEYGDVAPEVPELEALLYGTEQRVTEGGHRENLDEIEVLLEGPTKVAPIQKASVD